VFVEFARRKLANAGAPQEVDQYLRQYVLDPIGAPLVMFKRGGDGNLWLGAGATATARSWAAFGELIRRGGVWRAQHVLEPAVYREMVMGRAVSGMRYGLGFWLGMATATNDPVPDGAPDIWQLGAGVPVDTIMAAGAGAQRLYAIPSRRLVIVRQGNPNPPDGAAAWSDSAFLRLVLAQV
jgi:CubicO group peptidase (beta-lactamase class C family)